MVYRHNVQRAVGSKTYLRAINLFLLVFSMCYVALPILSYASSSDLTNLFYSAGFSGNTEVFSHMNWVGKGLSTLISGVCLLGIVILGARMILTILYKSGENLFDRVHDIKSKGQGKKFFGMQEVGRDAFNGNLGTGVDALFGFVLSLAPDIREYSDYAEGKVKYNLQESDTIAQWFMKVSLSYIVTIFFFAAGYSGSLMQAYATVADGMAVAMDAWINTDLTQMVDRALNTGSNYQFAFDNGTKLGDFQQRVSRSVYSAVLKKTANVDTTAKQNIGISVENWVSTNITQNSIAGMGLGYKETDGDIANLSFSMSVNSSPSFGSKGSTVKNIKTYRPGVESGLEANSGDYYFHVIITRKANAAETNYWEVNKKAKSSGVKNNTAVDIP